MDVVAALKRNGVGDVDDSSLARALYSTDASLYRVVPEVVVRPRDGGEVLAVLDACRQTGTPLTSRGAGTSVAGNAVGTGVIVDFSKYMNNVLRIDAEAKQAVVQPGVVHAVLQKHATPHGLRYGPDPSTHTRCTVGGMIGNNACGNRALGYGRSADNVVSLKLATAAGQQLHVGRDVGTVSPTLDVLRGLVDSYLGTIRTEFGRFGRQVSGYSLEHLLPERRFDVASFMAGTEGTLAVTLEATVDLVSEAAHRHLVLLGYGDMFLAADDVPHMLGFEPIACEGLDAFVVDVFRGIHGSSSVPDMPTGGGWLMVELAGNDQAELAAAADRVVVASSASSHRHVTSVAEQARLWRIREEGAGLAGRSFDRPALSGWEDAAVPPERLGSYLREFNALMDERNLHGAIYGHFGDGCIHTRIDFDLDGSHENYREFIFDAAAIAAAHDGSFSGEHGDGRARSELLPLMYSQSAIDLFAQVKGTFDPDNLLNPGVLVQPRAIDDDLRGQRRDWGSQLERKGFNLTSDGGSFGAAVHRCTGVGKCRADPGPAAVMCPSFRASGDEKDSTRGRARVLQEMVDGRLVDGGWQSPEVREALDLCLSCKGCLSDCPTGIDMASYKSEVLYQSYKRRLRPRSHYILGRLPQWAQLMSPVAGLVNLSLRLPGLAHLARWVAGVDQRRSLPTFATERFSNLVKPTSAADNRVVIWVDSFTEFFSSAAGLAAVNVLERAGYGVEVLDKTSCCGLTWISTGQLDTAKKLAAGAVEQLHPYAAEKIPIVGLEPSCLAVLRHDAVELLDDPRALEVSRGVFTLAELLAANDDLALPDLTGLDVVVQPHCHQSAVMGFAADLELLERTGARVTKLGGCCGLAGNFGVEKGHYETSVAVAEQQLLPAVRAAGRDAVVLADGFSCRTQLEDLADVQAVHLAQLLNRPLTQTPSGRR
jgi:FAD/FMN-containing dehydrogenase/Fe-S oxidoreductase